MYIVIVEWDGKQPPTTYYNGLRRLHLRVRGDKHEEPMVRRARTEDHSVIAQEGAVLVESQSLAFLVSHLANECGARTVMVGECEFPEEQKAGTVLMTPAEREVVNRFNKAFRQRGRPTESGSERSWVVSCPECAHTSVTVAEKQVVQCPNCGGMRAAVRVGYQHIFSHFPVSLDEYRDMYFVEGYYEEPAFTQDPHIMCESTQHVELQSENLDTFSRLEQSPMIVERLVPQMSKNRDYLQLLSDIFVSRRYYTAKDRQRPRTTMIVDLLQRGVAPSKVPLIEGDEFEVLDACVIGHENDLIRLFYLNL